MRSIGWRPFPNGTRRKAEWQRLLCRGRTLKKKILFPNPERKLKVTEGIPLQKPFQDPRDGRKASKCPLSLLLSLSLPPSLICMCMHKRVGVFPSTGTCGGQSLAADLPPLPLTLFFWIKFSQLNLELTGFLASLSGQQALKIWGCQHVPLGLIVYVGAGIRTHVLVLERSTLPMPPCPLTVFLNLLLMAPPLSARD